jgi:hypothetical protein
LGPNRTEGPARGDGGGGDHSMTCAELGPDYDAFALGLIETPIRDEIREHLARECNECIPTYHRALELVTSLATSVTPTDPPARLRRKVIAMVKPEVESASGSFGFGWNLVWGATAGLAAIVAVLFGIQVNRLSGLRVADAERVRRATEIVSAPDSIDVRFGEPSGPPRGHVFVSRARGVALIVSRLPQIDSSKTLELWRIPKRAGAKPKPAGTFRPASDGSAIAIDTSTVDPNDLAAIAVTVEPKGGVLQPTTQPIVIAPIG